MEIKEFWWLDFKGVAHKDKFQRKEYSEFWEFADGSYEMGRWLDSKFQGGYSTRRLLYDTEGEALNAALQREVNK